jgi:hypothetical protein
MSTDTPGTPAAPVVLYPKEACALVNPGTLELCEAAAQAVTQHFEAYCAVVGKRRPVSALAREREKERRSLLHDAVERLRTHCEQDLAAAAVEREQLMRIQVESGLASEAELRMRRTARERHRIRQAWVDRRRGLLAIRDALWCGLGWPHPCEPVLVTASWYGDDGETVYYEGEALYTRSDDTHGISHSVRLPDGVVGNHGSASVHWEPQLLEDERGRWGKADPQGDIAMRVASRPDRRLPCPHVRWPDERDVGPIDPLVRVAAGQQMQLA